MPALEVALEKRGVRDNALLAGAIFGEEKLAKWFGIAEVFVYTDAIGLSLYHAFGYGIPVVAHDNLAIHGPEMGVFVDGATGLTYREKDVADMAGKIARLLDDETLRTSIGERVSRIAREDYNAQVMYERFVAAMLDLASDEPPLPGEHRGL